jgi:hypothetical protein
MAANDAIHMEAPCPSCPLLCKGHAGLRRAGDRERCARARKIQVIARHEQMRENGGRHEYGLIEAPDLAPRHLAQSPGIKSYDECIPVMAEGISTKSSS